jgi:hypothetical protein
MFSLIYLREAQLVQVTDCWCRVQLALGTESMDIMKDLKKQQVVLPVRGLAGNDFSFWEKLWSTGQVGDFLMVTKRTPDSC